MLHRLLTGKPPFGGKSIPILFRHILEDEPAALPAGVDKDLRTICRKCLEKDPTARYDSAAALADDLDLWRDRLPIRARPAGTLEAIAKWVRRRPWQAASLGAGLAALVGPTVIAILFILNLDHSRGHHPIVSLEGRTNDVAIIHSPRDSRVTFNVPSFPFDTRKSLWMRVEFRGVPDELRDSLKVRFRADWAVLPDPVRSPDLGHGDEAVVRAQIERHMLQDTFLYLEAIGWKARDVLDKYPAASVRLILLDGPWTNATAR